MRVLLDECIDWRLARDIVGHDVKTARQMGWASLKNGELLALTSKHFDVFITIDQNLPFQQNVGLLPFAIIILRAQSSRLADLKLLLPELLVAIASARRGTANLVGSP